MDEQHISIAILPHLEGFSGAHRDCLDLEVGLLFKHWNQHVQQSRILCGSGGRQDNVRVRWRLYRGSCGRTAGGQCKRKNTQEGEKDRAWGEFHSSALL